MKKALPWIIIALAVAVMAFVGISLIVDAVNDEPLATAMPTAVPTEVPADATAEDVVAANPLPTMVKEITFEEYKSLFGTLLEANAPGTVISWELVDTNTYAVITENMMIGVIVTVRDGLVNEAYYMTMDETLTEDMFNAFVGMSTYVVAPLAMKSGVAIENVLNDCMNAIYSELLNVMNGVPSYDFGGLPMYMMFGNQEDGTYAMQTVLDLLPDETATTTEATAEPAAE